MLADGAILITPSSSFVRPGTGLAHTNLHLFHPAQGLPTASPASAAPPLAGNYNETPASIACIYALVPAVTGCNPQTAVAVPSGGGGFIAIVDAFHAPNAMADLNIFVITHPYRADQAAVRAGTGAARASRMAASAVRPARRPVATMEQRSA